MKKDEERSLDDPLGIADAPVPQDADDIHATNDPDEVARRRARALGETDGDVRTGPGDINEDGFGATSIDMGYGGEGNARSKNDLALRLSVSAADAGSRPGSASAAGCSSASLPPARRR